MLSGCREILFNMREESSTEGSSEEEADSLDSEDEDTESPEEKDHLGKCYLLEGQCWAAILKNVSFKAIQIHNF